MYITSTYSQVVVYIIHFVCDSVDPNANTTVTFGDTAYINFCSPMTIRPFGTDPRLKAPSPLVGQSS